jgi:hypothetical protein
MILGESLLREMTNIEAITITISMFRQTEVINRPLYSGCLAAILLLIDRFASVLFVKVILSGIGFILSSGTP